MPSQAIANQFALDPVTFMKSNVVYWSGPAPVTQAVITVAMRDAPMGATARRRDGLRKVNAPYYQLRHHVPGAGGGVVADPTFQAVWSGYQHGTGTTATLPAAGGPNLMLTPQLSGCAVVCRSNPDGSAQFSHYNLVSGGDTLAQADMEAIADAQYGGGHAVLTKEAYRGTTKRGGNVLVNVVGFRQHGTWGFWAQYQEDKPSGQQLRRVRKLA